MLLRNEQERVECERDPRGEYTYSFLLFGFLC